MRTLLAILLLAISPPAFAKVVVRQQLMMGNIPVTLTIDTKNESRAQMAMSAAFHEARRLEDLLSDYKNTSDISKINRAQGQWIEISNETPPKIQSN